MIDGCTKYVRVTVEKADGTILVDEKPGDEPLFVFRGQDALAHWALEAYANALRVAGVPAPFVRHIEEHIEAFQQWPNQKTPD